MSVRQAVVIIENHDGGDDAGGDHEHDAVEVCAWRQPMSKMIVTSVGRYLSKSSWLKGLFLMESSLLLFLLRMWIDTHQNFFLNFFFQPTAFFTWFLSTRNAKKDHKANGKQHRYNWAAQCACRCASPRSVYFSWFSLTGSLLSVYLLSVELAFLSVHKYTAVSFLKTSSTSQPFVLFSWKFRLSFYPSLF